MVTYKKYEQANTHHLPTARIHLAPSQSVLLPPEPVSPKQDDYGGYAITRRSERHSYLVEADRGFGVRAVLETE